MRKNIIKKIMFMFMLLFLAIPQSLVASAQEYTSKNGNTMVLTLFQNPKTLDIQNTNADYFIPLQIYSRLVDVEVDQNGDAKIIPSLAESWEINEEGTEYTFKLKKGVKFHNGEELKADDVLFTINKATDSEKPMVNAFVFKDILGFQERIDGDKESIKGVEVVDDYTVKITLKEPTPSFLADLTGAPASIYNRKAVEAGGDKFGFEKEFTVGTGYMKYENWTQDQEINLVKNEDYFGEPAKIDGVKYLMNIDSSTARMMFENGELDYIGLNSDGLAYFQGKDEWKKYIGEITPPSMDYVQFNQNDQYLSDAKVRRAVQLAINRDLINQTFYNGQGTLLNGVLPPVIPGYNDKQEPIPFDPEQSKKLLEEAGYKDGIKLVLLQNGESDYTHPINEMMQSMLAEVGIQVEIKNVDMTTFWDTVASGKDFSLKTGPVTADIPDPAPFFVDFTVEQSKSNGYNIKDEELSKKIEQANKQLDPEKRIQELQGLENEMVSEQALYLPLLAEKRYYIISPRLKDFQLGWQGWVALSTAKVSIDESFSR